MPRNKESFGPAGSASTGGSGGVTTMFGGTVDPAAGRRMQEQRLAALHDPGRPTLFARDAYHDPNLIIITSDMVARPTPPATPEMARASALRHAAFRTDAELFLLSNLEIIRAETFDDTGLDDREATSLFRQQASLLARDAIEGATRKFGVPEDQLEMSTRMVMEDIIESAASEGTKARARALEEKALDTLEAGVDDLIVQVRTAPGLAEGYAAQMTALADRYEGGVDAEALAAFRANTARELTEAHVLGLAEAGRLDEARTVLAKADFADEQKGFLERSLEQRALATQQVSEGVRLRKHVALELSIQEGESTAAEIAEAQAAGTLSPVDVRRLAQLAEERRDREARRGDLIAGVEQALRGEGPAPDTTTPEGREAVDLYLERVLMPALADDDPAFRDAGLAWLAGRFGHVPDSAQREILAQIQPGQPAGVRMAAVNRIAAIAEAGGGALIEAFPRDMRAFVNAVLQAEHDTIAARIAYADNKVALEGLQSEEPGPLVGKGVPAFASHLLGEAVGAAAIAAGDEIVDAPVIYTGEFGDFMNVDAADAIAREAGFVSADAMIRATVGDFDAQRLEPVLGRSILAKRLNDGRYAVVSLEAERGADGGAAFRVVGVDVREAERVEALEEGPELPIGQLQPFLIEDFGPLDENGVPSFAVVVDPETGEPFRIEAEQYRHLDEIARLYVESDGELGRETQEAIGLFILEMMPGTGELISAMEAYDAFSLAVAASQDGDVAGTIEHALWGGLAVLGAIPIVGGAVRLTRKIATLLPALANLVRRTPTLHQARPFQNTPGTGDHALRIAQQQQDVFSKYPSLGPSDFEGSATRTFQRTTWPPADAGENYLRGLAAFDRALVDGLLNRSINGSRFDGRIENAMYRDRVEWDPSASNPGEAPFDLGAVDFYWGLPGTPGGGGYKGGAGWSHIVAKHGIEVVEDVIDVLARGRVFDYATDNTPYKLTLIHDNHQVTLVLHDPGRGEANWLLTGFDRRDESNIAFDLSVLEGPVFFTTP